VEQKRLQAKQADIDAEIAELEAMSDSDGEIEQIFDEIPDKKNKKNGNGVVEMSEDQPCTSAAAIKQENGNGANGVEDEIKAVIKSGNQNGNGNGNASGQKRKNKGNGQKKKFKKMKN